MGVIVKRIIVMLVLSLSGSISSAAEIKTACQMGFGVDLDVNFNTDNDSIKAGIEVIIYDMQGNSQSLTNFDISKPELEATLYMKPIVAAVSTSGLSQIFDGVYPEAGLIKVEYNQAKQKFDVLFAYNSNVYKTECKAGE